MDVDWTTDKDGIFASYFEALDAAHHATLSRALRASEVATLIAVMVTLKFGGFNAASAEVNEFAQRQITKIPDAEEELLQKTLVLAKNAADMLYGAGTAEDMLKESMAEWEAARGKAN